MILKELKRFEAEGIVTRKMIPVARRVLGDNHEFTLKMRWTYAMALYKADGATLDDIRAAVTTLEELERTARRVFGGAHPTTSSLVKSLEDARAALVAREAEATEAAAQDAHGAREARPGALGTRRSTGRHEGRGRRTTGSPRFSSRSRRTQAASARRHTQKHRHSIVPPRRSSASQRVGRLVQYGAHAENGRELPGPGRRALGERARHEARLEAAAEGLGRLAT